jgi:hypothetical protein
LLTFGTLARTQHNEDFTTAEDQHTASVTSKEWQRFLKRKLDGSLKNKQHQQFQVPGTTKLHGTNSYQSLSMFVHLAALNPDPTLVTLYKILLSKDYDIDMDHSIESLVQLLYRTSLRNANAKEPVLLVTPYRSSVELLFQKVGCATQPKITAVGDEPLMELTYRKATDAAIRKARAVKAGESMTRKWSHRDPETKKEINRRRANLRAAKLALDKDPTNKQRIFKVAGLTAELEAFIRSADYYGGL